MMERKLTRDFGVAVRRLRIQMEMSQEELADLCGLHRTYIGSIERGEKTVTIETANRIAVGLGISIAQLFDELERE